MTCVAQVGQRVSLVFRQTRALAASHFVGGDLDQLVGTRFTHQNGDFVVCRLSSVLFGELLDGFVTLAAALADTW